MTGIGIALIVLSILFLLEYNSILLVAFCLLTGIGFIMAGSKMKELMRADVASKDGENQ